MAEEFRDWRDEVTVVNDPSEPLKWDPDVGYPGKGPPGPIEGPPADLTGLDEFMTPEGAGAYTTGEHQKQFARHAIPAAASAAGMILGPGVSALAGFGAESFVQGIGLAEQSETNRILAGIAPLAGPALGAGIRGSTRLMGRMVPGASTWLHETAVATLGGFQASMQAALGSVDDAWRAITMGPVGLKKVGIKGIIKRIGELSNDEAVLKQYGAGSGRLLKRFNSLTEGFEGFDEVPLKHLDLFRRRVGGWIGKSKGEEQGAYKQLYKSVMDAAEEVTDPAFKKALAISKIEHGLMDFGEMVTKNGTASLADGTVVLMPKAIFQQLRINKDLVRMLGPARVRLIDKFMKGLVRHVPTVNTAPGMLVASRITGSMGAMLAGGALGYGAGGATGAPALIQQGAAAVGALAGPGILRTLGDAVARLTLSDPGRAALKMIYQEAGGRLGPPAMAAIMQASRSLTADAFLNQPQLPKEATKSDQKPTKKGEFEKIFFPGAGA